MTNINPDDLVFYWVEEPSEVYVGRSREEIKEFVERITDKSISEDEIGLADCNVKRFCIDEDGKELNLSLRDLLEKDLKEHPTMQIPNLAWTAYA